MMRFGLIAYGCSGNHGVGYCYRYYIGTYYCYLGFLMTNYLVVVRLGHELLCDIQLLYDRIVDNSCNFR